jgi:DNA-binding response OmpR family regulator
LIDFNDHPSKVAIIQRKEKSMNSKPSRNEVASALLVYARVEPLHTLRVTLASRGINTWRARTCQEARSFLARVVPVDVVFTETNLRDGTWADLCRESRHLSTPVVVVAPETDPKLWSDVIEHGGIGLVAPPFAVPDLLHYVRRSAAAWRHKLDPVSCLDRKRLDGPGRTAGKAGKQITPRWPLLSEGIELFRERKEISPDNKYPRTGLGRES